jgi:DNA-directed RNA polymerase specialized sigma subunit, sigma24 homolog
MKLEITSLLAFLWFTKKPIFYNILSYVKSYEIAEDLLQETFVNFLKNLKKFDKNKSVLAYLMVLSKNLSLDYLKKNKEIISEDNELDLAINNS